MFNKTIENGTLWLKSGQHSITQNKKKIKKTTVSRKRFFIPNHWEATFSNFLENSLERKVSHSGRGIQPNIFFRKKNPVLRHARHQAIIEME